MKLIKLTVSMLKKSQNNLSWHTTKAWLAVFVYLSACIAPVSGMASPVRSYEQQLEQVRLYINNEMYEAARTELLKLSQSKSGQQDERVYIALAKVTYKLHQITMALSYLRTARSLAKVPQAKEKLSSLYEQWLSTYGLVRFEPADQVQRGIVNLSRKRKLINKERQAALEYAQKALKKGVDLPLSLYLPYGHYSANGTSFKLKRNAPTPIVELMLVPMAEPQKQPSSSHANQHWLYIGFGSAAVVALGIVAYSLSQDEEAPSNRLTINITDGR